MHRFYIILELADGSTQDEVKSAFHRLAKIHHPDKGGNAERFKKISEAYTYLRKHAPVQRIVSQHTTITYRTHIPFTPTPRGPGYAYDIYRQQQESVERKRQALEREMRMFRATRDAQIEELKRRMMGL